MPPQLRPAPGTPSPQWHCPKQGAWRWPASPALTPRLLLSLTPSRSTLCQDALPASRVLRTSSCTPPHPAIHTLVPDSVPPPPLMSFLLQALVPQAVPAAPTSSMALTPAVPSARVLSLLISAAQTPTHPSRPYSKCHLCYKILPNFSHQFGCKRKKRTGSGSWLRKGSTVCATENARSGFSHRWTQRPKSSHIHCPRSPASLPPPHDDLIGGSPPWIWLWKMEACSPTCNPGVQ